MRILSSLLFVCLIFAHPVSAQTTTAPAAELPEGVPAVEFQSVRVTMTTSNGEYPMLLELATTPAQAQRGLMYRPDLPDDYGMLFVMPQERVQAFWMQNTLSPLDIIYINTDNTVVSIAKGEPLDTTSLPSQGPAKFVFEIRQGLADVYGIKSGTKLTFE